EAGQGLDEGVDAPDALRGRGARRARRAGRAGASEEVGQGERGTDLGIGAAWIGAGETVAGEHPLLEALRPGDHRGAGGGGCLNGHVDVAGDPSLPLELLEVLGGGEVGWGQVADARLDAGPRTAPPAACGEQEAGCEAPPRPGERDRDRGDTGSLEPGGDAPVTAFVP